MRTSSTSTSLARLTAGALLSLSVSAAMASLQVVPVGNAFDTPNGIGTFQSGSTDLNFSSDWLDFTTLVNVKQAPVEPSYYPVVVALEGVRSDDRVVSPVNIVSVDGDQRTLNGAASLGGLRLDRPTLNGLSTFGSLTVSNVYADLATGTVYGNVEGANGVGSKSSVALWQADGIIGSSTTFEKPACQISEPCQTGDSIVTHAELQNLTLTSEGVDIFARSLGMPTFGVAPLSSTIFGTLAVNAVFTVPAGYALTPAGAVPEPGTWALMGLGLIGLFGATRRRA